MFAECDKHYPSRSGQTSLAAAVTNITKPVTNINFGPIRELHKFLIQMHGAVLQKSVFLNTTTAQGAFVDLAPPLLLNDSA